MFVPFSCGATLVRDGGRVLRDSFDMSPEYLSEDRGGADVEFDFFRYGQMGTRRFNSLKLWMAIKFMGARGYAQTVERHIGLTNYLASKLDAAAGVSSVWAKSKRRSVVFVIFPNQFPNSTARNRIAFSSAFNKQSNAAAKRGSQPQSCTAAARCA